MWSCPICAASSCCAAARALPARLGSGTGNAPGCPTCPEACSGTSGLPSSLLRAPWGLGTGLEVPVLAVGRSALRPATAYAWPAAARVLAVCLIGRGTPAHNHCSRILPCIPEAHHKRAYRMAAQLCIQAPWLKAPSGIDRKAVQMSLTGNISKDNSALFSGHDVKWQRTVDLRFCSRGGCCIRLIAGNTWAIQGRDCAPGYRSPALAPGRRLIYCQLSVCLDVSGPRPPALARGHRQHNVQRPSTAVLQMFNYTPLR